MHDVAWQSKVRPSENHRVLPGCVCARSRAPPLLESAGLPRRCTYHRPTRVRTRPGFVPCLDVELVQTSAAQQLVGRGARGAPDKCVVSSRQFSTHDHDVLVQYQCDEDESCAPHRAVSSGGKLPLPQAVRLPAVCTRDLLHSQGPLVDGVLCRGACRVSCHGSCRSQASAQPHAKVAEPVRLLCVWWHVLPSLLRLARPAGASAPMRCTAHGNPAQLRRHACAIT